MNQLNNMSIYELRARARMVGVKAPTTKTASKLIEEIVAIETGKMLPTKSNMGRPPKSLMANKIKENILESSLYKNDYEQIKLEKEMALCDGNLLQEINTNIHDFMGIIRCVDGCYYVNNYFRENDVVLINSNNDIVVGDLVYGECKKGLNFSNAISFKKLNFKDSKKESLSCVVKCEDVEEMYKNISQKQGLKIIVDIESKYKNISSFNDNEIWFLTKECEDIIKSYNLLLDIKNMVDVLCKSNKEFTIFFVDVEYVYSVLYMYYHFKGVSEDINAMQYFKELLSLINNSKGAEINLLQEKDGKKSSYLEIVLNKYCKK